MGRNLDELVAVLKSHGEYEQMFAEAYPDQEAPINLTNISNALSQFQRSMVSGNSQFDRWLKGNGQLDFMKSY